MEMADDKWKIAGDLCRCCLAEGSHNKLRVAKLNKDSGDNEDFANMLLENLGLTILPVKCVLSEITYTICNPCVERLRDVVSFRKQVQLSEEKFWNMYERNLLIAIEPIVVKVEDMETDDTYKGASDDGFNMDGFSDDDAQLNFIEIKAEAKKHKGKARAGTKAASAKKTPIRKMAARKTKTKTMMDAESVKAQKQKVKTEKTETIKTEEDEEDAPAEEKAPVKKNKDDPVFENPAAASEVGQAPDMPPTFLASNAPENSLLPEVPLKRTFIYVVKPSCAKPFKLSKVLKKVQGKTRDLAASNYDETFLKITEKEKGNAQPKTIHNREINSNVQLRKVEGTRVVDDEFHCGDCGRICPTEHLLRNHFTKKHRLKKCKHCAQSIVVSEMFDHVKADDDDEVICSCEARSCRYGF